MKIPLNEISTPGLLRLMRDVADVLGVDDKHWSLSISKADAVGGFVRVRVEIRD